MAAVTVETEFGYVVTCTGGTGVPTYLQNSAGAFIVAPTQSVKILGISCGGNATTDIVTVQNGEGTLLYGGAVGTPGTYISMQLGGAIRVTGLQVGFQGTTAGTCIIFKTNN